MNRYIETIIISANGATKQFYTAKDIISERNSLRQKALDMLNTVADDGVEHLVYYRDIRRSDGGIEKAYFYYDLIGCADEEFYSKWAKIDGFVGAVHRREVA